MSPTPVLTPRAPSVPEDHPPRPRNPVTRVAVWSATHRWLAIALWVAFVATTIVLGGVAGTRLQTDAKSGSGESGRVDRIVEKTAFGEKPVENVLFSARTGALGTSADAAAADLARRLTALPAVKEVAAPTRSADGSSLLVRVTMAVPDSASPDEASDIAEAELPAVQAVTAAVQAANPTIRVEQAGDSSLSAAVDEVVTSDFQRAELTSVPVTLLILLVVFGALVAASVPVLLAITSVGSALGLSALASHLVPVSEQFSSVVLLVGMAVGVDYSLFYVRREREERARGASARQPVELAAQTAGHAIVVSGLAVIVAMAGLFCSGTSVFVSFGIGATLVVAVAMIGSITVLPALLSLLGNVLDRPRVPFLHRRSRRRAQDASHTGESRPWSAILRPVLRSPKVALVVAGGALVLLAMPAAGMRLASGGTDSLPRSVPEIRAYDRLVAAFPDNHEALTVVAASSTGRPLDRGAVTAALSTVAVNASSRSTFVPLEAGEEPEVQFSRDGTVARVDVPMEVDGSSEAGHAGVEALRTSIAPGALDALTGTTWGVTGGAAWDMDFNSAMTGNLPLVLLFVVGMTFLVMLASFRAPVIALVSIGLNLLSVGAAYGLMVMIFQNTWAEGLLDFRSNGAITSWLPLFAFVILFGLSMDYTVLVVSRVREAVLAGETSKEAVRIGITRTAGVVTSAAVIMVAVFGIFATLSLLEFKQMGVGLAAAILIDATVVRAVLLPAVLSLLGDRAWPASVRRAAATRTDQSVLHLH